MHDTPTTTIPDVVISGALAMDLMEVLLWAAYHAGATEGIARGEIERARFAFDVECVRSWMTQEEAV